MTHLTFLDKATLIKRIGFFLCVFFICLSSLAMARQPNKISEESLSKEESIPQKPQGKINCKLTFHMKSWSFLYKSGKGSGVISCSNGKTKNVKITMHGGGFTVGKRDIAGRGTFTPVYSLESLYGSYGFAEGHAGAKKSTGAQIVTNGKVTLKFTVSGEGFNLGVDMGRFKITPL